MHIILLLSFVLSLSPAYADVYLNQGMEEYTPITDAVTMKGNIKILGSTRLEPFAIAWGKDFRKFYKKIKFDIKAAGSSTAPPKLTEDKIHIAAMSRAMTEEELDKFHTEKGYYPLKLQVALDAVAVYVHRKNPIKSITLTELDAIFSQQRNCGETQAISHWRDLGWPYGKDIQLFGHTKKSGAHKVFKKMALCKGKFKENIPKMIYQDELLHSISMNRYSIGYSSLNLTTSYSIKALLLARQAYFPAYFPSEKNIASGAYPLTRYLHLYLNKVPNQALSPPLYEFIKFVLSKQGQALVEQNGAIPMTPHLVGMELLKLQ